MPARSEDHMRLVKKITEIYEDDDEADDLAAVDGVVMDDAGTLGDSEDADAESTEDDDAEESHEEPEERLPRSRKLAAPRRKAR